MIGPFEPNFILCLAQISGERFTGPLVLWSKLLMPVTWNQLKKWTYVSIEGQGHFLTLAQGYLHTKLKLLLFSEITGPNFLCKLSGTRKWKFIDMMLVTWPRWLPCPYMVKTLQKSSSLEPVDRFPWNLVVASMTPAHHNLFKWWSWVDLDLFNGKVNFGNWGFSIGKSETVDFSELLQPVTWSCIKLWRYVSIEGQGPETYWEYADMWVLKVKVISWPWPKVIYIW